MKLTEDQLYIMTFANKTLEMGCIITHRGYYNSGVGFVKTGQIVNISDRTHGGVQGRDQYMGQFVITYSSGGFNIFSISKKEKNNPSTSRVFDIIGIPVTYSRLVYLYYRFGRRKSDEIDGYYEVVAHFIDNPEELNKDVLTWSPETIEVVKNFLMSLPKSTDG